VFNSGWGELLEDRGIDRKTIGQLINAIEREFLELPAPLTIDAEPDIDDLPY
jgi:hypothetical protein